MKCIFNSLLSFLLVLLIIAADSTKMITYRLIVKCDVMYMFLEGLPLRGLCGASSMAASTTQHLVVTKS